MVPLIESGNYRLQLFVILSIINICAGSLHPEMENTGSVILWKIKNKQGGSM